MSLFIFSLLAGLLLHQIVSIIQPKDESSEYLIGRRIVVKFEDGTYLILKAIGLALAIVLFVVLVTLIVTRGVHPSDGYAYGFADALTSPRTGAAVFGGLVGFLIGNLLNRILMNVDYEFKTSDRLEMLLIFMLVILGIGGEEWLKSAAQRINKISVGTTTEIAFSDNRPKSSRAAAEQPNSARRTTTDESSGSAGLGKLGDLRDNILGNDDPKYKYKSDKDFMQILALYERAPAPDLKVTEVGSLPTQVLGPIGTCLSGIFALNGDTAFIQQQLAPLSTVLRDVVTPPVSSQKASAGQKAPEKTPEEKQKELKDLREQLKKQVDAVAKYATARGEELTKIAENKPAYSCEEVIGTFKDPSAISEASIDDLTSSSDKLPYAAMAYASVMAALHHYDAAVIAMFKWIEKRQDDLKKMESRTVDKTEMVKARWSLLRARFAQGAFIEEWIRVRGPAASNSLRQYHIDNLKAIIDGMKSFSVIREMSQKNSDYELKPALFGVAHSEDDGDCTISDIPKVGTKGGPPSEDDRHTLGKLYESYLSAKNDYVDQALKHPIVKVKAATRIGEEAVDLIKHNLRCVEESRRVRIRAGHIDRFVRSEINLMDNLSPLKPSSDEIRNRIRETQQKLTFAFQLVEGEATRTRNEQSTARTLQARLQPDSIVEVYETLFATQDQLRDFSEREVTP